VELSDRKYCYTIEGVFTPAVIVGFTKPTLQGNPLKDLKKALTGLCKNFKIAHLKQIHSPTAHAVSRQGIYEGDGLFSDKENLALVVRTADCLPIFFYSKELGSIGMIHMGWQGAMRGILNNMPHDKLSSFKVIVGLGLRKCCYALGEEFLKQQEMSPFLEKRGNGLYFDPVAFAKAVLLEKGLKEENFLDLNLCSFCSKKGFFSYRRDKTSSRTLSFIIKNCS
jgi:YfiH family protein